MQDKRASHGRRSDQIFATFDSPLRRDHLSNLFSVLWEKKDLPSFRNNLSLSLSLSLSLTHTHTGSTDATKHGMRERKKVTFILATLFSVTREGRIKQVSLYDNVIVVYVVNVVSVVFVGVVVDIIVVVANLNRTQNSSQFFPEIVS